MEIGDVVRRIVATATQTRHLIRYESTHHRRVHRIFLEAAGTRVAVQALGVFESARYADGRRIGRLGHVLQIDSLETTHFVVQRTIEGVVRMAGVAGHVRWDSVVLKMLGGNVIGVVNVETLPVRNHDVTGRAELRRFRSLYMSVHPADEAQSREHTQANKSDDPPTHRGSD